MTPTRSTFRSRATFVKRAAAFAFTAILLTATVAHAQYGPRRNGGGYGRAYAPGPAPDAGIYGMFSAQHYSGLGVGNGTAATQSGGITGLGGIFGAFADLPSYASPVHVGVDGRLLVSNSANSTPYGNKLLGGLGGLRVDGSGIPHTYIIPYAQLEIGGIATNNGTQTNRVASFAYQVQFGADFPLVVRQLRTRVEYGAGQLIGNNNSITGSNTNHTLQTFSAGVVFRFN